MTTFTCSPLCSHQYVIIAKRETQANNQPKKEDWANYNFLAYNSWKVQSQNKINKLSKNNYALSCSKSDNEKTTYFCWQRHLLVAVIDICESTQFQFCNFQTRSKVDSIELNHYFNSWKVQSHINKIKKTLKK